MSPRPRALLFVVASILATMTALEANARAQACCVGASGLTPGWLSNHERALIGAQARISQTHGTYPARGSFYVPTPGRDGRLETSLFASDRFLPRAQVSTFFPLATVRRRSGDITETRVSPGDLTLVGRYDLVRTGESTIPGIHLILGMQMPTGVPSDRGAPLLAADVTGIGAWEVNGGVTVEQVVHHVVLHATVLAGVRTARDVFGLEQRLGPRALYLLAGGWVFDNDVAILGTVTHTSEGDASLGGDDAPGTGFRATQVALLVVTPITDTLRLRTSAFTDVPPLGENRPALGGTSLSLAKSWF